jgi:ribosome-associated protein
MIAVTDSIVLSDDEIKERFIRSPGPGGQNVNKVESAVQLRFDAANSPALSAAVLRRLVPMAGSRMTRAGVIVLTANRFRTQERNRRDALERLIELIRQAAVEPKRRRPTKPTAGSRQRRLDTKRERSGIKKGRGKADPFD